MVEDGARAGKEVVGRGGGGRGGRCLGEGVDGDARRADRKTSIYYCSARPPLFQSDELGIKWKKTAWTGNNFHLF